MKSRKQKVLAGVSIVLLPICFFVLLFVACYSCRETPKNWQYATDLVPDGRVKLVSSRAVSGHSYEHIYFDGEELGLVAFDKGVELSQCLASISEMLSGGIAICLHLPVEGKVRRVSCYGLTKLNDGTILITGGFDLGGGDWVLPGEKISSFDPVKTWIFDPETKKLVTGPNMLHARAYHTTALLDDGRVFVCGGRWKGEWPLECEIYNPASGKFEPGAVLHCPRIDHSVTQLSNGRVLIAGGYTVESASDSCDSLISTVELINLPTKACTIVGQLHHSRMRPSTFATSDGALIVGGEDDCYSNMPPPTKPPEMYLNIRDKPADRIARWITWPEVFHGFKLF